jgi:type II secretory ATPase GspE/PulE/Tfp pilus assembly ATPase PilB-like protein
LKQLGDIKLNAELIYRAKGCNKCAQIGYRGRAAIAEVMIVNETVRELINQRASYLAVRDAAIAAGMQSLRDIAIKKVESGVTSLEEAISVTM